MAVSDVPAGPHAQPAAGRGVPAVPGAPVGAGPDADGRGPLAALAGHGGAAVDARRPRSRPRVADGYAPPPSGPGLAWAPVEQAHYVVRVDPRGRQYAVDTCFPARLTGRVDLSSVDEHTADALYGLARLVQPRVVLETGTHKGRATQALARALVDNAQLGLVPYTFTLTQPTGHLWTVDRTDFGAATALSDAERAVCTLVVGETPDALTRPPFDTLTGIELAVLDGDHTAEGLDAELTYVAHHRAAECWVLVDNSRDTGWPGVARTLREWAPRVGHVSFPGVTGLDVLWWH